MTTESSERPSEPDTDELTAYLDGELTRAETLALESRLASDVTLRRELAQLQKTWDMLDTLPRAKADETFSTTTMSLAADLLKKETVAKRSRPWLGRLGMILSVATLLLVSLGGGYYVITSVVERPEREMERDLHLLHNFSTYSHLSDNYLGDKNLEFLRLLQSSGLFVTPEAVEAAAKAEPTTLEDLSDEEKSEVARHYQSLKSGVEGPTAAKYESMQKLAQQIGADASRANLLRVHERYYAWLQSLSRSEIRDIEDLSDPAARLDKIRTAWRLQSRQKLQTMLKDLRVFFTAKDYDLFRKWFCEFVDAHEAEIREQLKGRATSALREMERIGDADRKCMRLYHIYSWRVGEDKAIVPSEEDFSKLKDLLSDEAQKQFSTIEASEDQRRQVINALVDAAFAANFTPPPTEEELEKIWNTLSPAEREKLERMKALDQRRELTRRFEEQRAKSKPSSNNSKKSEAKKSGPNVSSEFKPLEQGSQKAE